MALGLARRHAATGATSDLEEALDRIGREKERLNELIGQLLELVRLESGETQAEHEQVDLDALVRDIAADAQFEAQARDRKVLLSGSIDCKILGSPELLRRAIENVVRNALTYTAPQTAVEVRLHSDGEVCSITVRDHGPGVPEESLERLFEPFYRVQTSRDRQSGGVGLGLAITQRAIRAHHGAVHACNVPDDGLQIEIRLPVSRERSI
jgi:two-component system sensor histidine kinase CpxA